MELKRDKNGYLDISNCYLDDDDTFFLNSKKYFFKLHKYEPYTYYNELIAEELAKDFNIPYAHYDLAKYNGKLGVISENFIKDNEKIYFIGNLINIDKHPINLENIWNELYLRYKDEELVYKLMNQLVNIFIYDILTANYDRHDFNLMIVENDNDVNFSKLFDNENILDLLAIENDDYALGIDDHDEDENNLIKKFLRLSSREYTELLQSKLWIIEEDNIDKVLLRVEKRIERKIPIEYKNIIKEINKKNRDKINNVLNEVNGRKLG